MKLLVCSLLVATQISFIFASYFPAPFRCFQSSPACTTTLAQTVTPVFLQQIPEPLTFDDLQIKQDGVQLDMRNVKVYGLRNLVMDHMSLDPITNMTRTVFRANIYATGLYRVNGKMFSTPIHGDGEMLFDHRNVEFEMLTQYDLIRSSDGLNYASAKGYQFRYDVKDNGVIRASNLYYGNKAQSDYMHYLFDQNWKLISEIYGRTYFREILDNFYYPLRSYLLTVPLNNLIV